MRLNVAFLPGASKGMLPHEELVAQHAQRPQIHLLVVAPYFYHLRRQIIQRAAERSPRLSEGACTDQPKSAIFSSPFNPSSRFSGLMSRWITCFWWQYPLRLRHLEDVARRLLPRSSPSP